MTQQFFQNLRSFKKSLEKNRIISQINYFTSIKYRKLSFKKISNTSLNLKTASLFTSVDFAKTIQGNIFPDRCPAPHESIHRQDVSLWQPSFSRDFHLLQQIIAPIAKVQPHDSVTVQKCLFLSLVKVVRCCQRNFASRRKINK